METTKASDKSNHLTILPTDEDGDETEHDLPSKFEVCHRCEGHGTHLNPAIGEHAYTREEFEESFDEEGREEYFRRGGIYDVTCHECKGRRVVPVVDESCLSAGQKEVFARLQKQKEERARWAAEERAERMMEARMLGEY